MKGDIPEEVQKPWRKRLHMMRENLGISREEVRKKATEIYGYEVSNISAMKLRSAWNLATMYGLSMQEFMGNLLGEDEPDYGTDAVAMARKEIMGQVAGLDLEKENLAYPIMKLLHTRARGFPLFPQVNRANLDNETMSYPRLWRYYRDMDSKDRELLVAIAQIILHDSTGIANIRTGQAKPGKEKEMPNGVRWDSERSKWRADFWYQGKHHFVGYFDDKEEARRSRHRARQKRYNEIFRELTGMSRKKSKKIERSKDITLDLRVPINLRYITRRKDNITRPFRVHIKNSTIGHFADLDDAFAAAREWLKSHGFDPATYYPDTLGPQNYKEMHEDRA